MLDAHEELKQILNNGVGGMRNHGQKLVLRMGNAGTGRGHSAVCDCERGNRRHSKDPLAIFLYDALFKNTVFRRVFEDAEGLDEGKRELAEERSQTYNSEEDEST